MCNIREVVLQEYDLQMYKGSNLERGMYLGKKKNSDTVPFSLKMPFV